MMAWHGWESFNPDKSADMGAAPPKRGTGEDLPLLLKTQVEMIGLPSPVREFRFSQQRRWRFDLAWLDQKVAIEVDGGGFMNGRHSRGKGIEGDCEKYAAALIAGWTVLRVTPKHLKSGEAVTWAETLLRQRMVG
jgi:hypothetical protein